MSATFAALLFAHVCADFLLQSNAMAAAKQARSLPALLLHGLIVLATATLALAPVTADPMVLLPLLALAGAHLLIDWIKSFAPAASLTAFLTDQGAHLATLIALAWALPGLYATSLWGAITWLPPVLVIASGLILATRAGGYAVGMLVRPFGRSFRAEGLPRGGELIGLLERGLIFLFVLVGQPAAVGFLIAAKSVLRFDASKRKQKVAEYVIIGTLASFGWALVCAHATLALLNLFAALPWLPGAE